MRRKMMSIIVLIICTAVFTAGSVRAVHTAQIDQGAATVVRAFKESGASFGRLQVNGWTTVDQTFLARDSALMYFNARVGKLFKPDSLPRASIIEKDGYIIMKIQGEVDEHVAASITMQVPAEGSKVLLRQSYLIISLGTSESLVQYDKMHRIMDTFSDGVDSHKSTVISGSYQGIMNRKKQLEILDKMLMVTDSSKVDTMADRQLISVTGYSPKVSKRLTYAGKSVNMNMALRYNFVEKKTLLYVGSPLITSEY